MRDGAVYLGLGTWYKYARSLGIKRKFFRLHHKRQIGIRASRPLELLHMDVTIFRPLDHSRVYIYFLVDNFSQFILGWRASPEFSSQVALQVLKEATLKYKIEISSKLITDGGPENSGEVSKFIANHGTLTKIVAQKDIIQSNSMVEAVNKHIKYYYLFKRELKNYPETVRYLQRSVQDYNNKPHGALFGLTPAEVLEGTIPDRGKFKQLKGKARTERIWLNQITKCCNKK